MNFTTLQDRLRRLLLDKISAGEFTGMALAARTGFQQAHISNFLNQKRSLSLDAMDQVLSSLDLSVLDLINNSEINRRAAAAPNCDKQFEAVPLIDMITASSSPVISREKTLDFLKFKKNFLRRLRSDASRDRKTWTRFVLIKADAENSIAMYPRLLPGSTLLIDRHYNSLRRYRSKERNMYLVRKGSEGLIRYLALHGNQLSLRPQVDSVPIVLVQIPAGAHYPEVIIGRVCHVGMET
jgi:hypothetical protein